MASTWTMYGRQQMLTRYLTSYQFSLQVALTRTVPVANASSAQLIEPVIGDYNRVDYPADDEHWSPTGFGELFNSQSIVFPEVTKSWGLISGWALVDVEAALCIAVGSVKDPFVAETGMTPRIAPGVMLLGNYD